LPKKLSSVKAYEKRGEFFMDKKVKRDSQKSNPRINQFIIECLFNKYFEEKKDSRVDVQKEEVRV